MWRARAHPTVIAPTAKNAAVEAREAARRIQDAARNEISRYYQEQKSTDVASATALLDDFKRKGREFKERQGEAQMLESLYQASQRGCLQVVRCHVHVHDACAAVAAVAMLHHCSMPAD